MEKKLPLKLEDATGSEGSGMIWENGPFVYPFRRKRRVLRASLSEVYTTLTGLPVRHAPLGRKA